MTNERRKQIRKRRKEKNKNKNRIVQWFKKLSKGKKAALIAGAVVLMLNTDGSMPSQTEIKLVSVAASFLGKQTEE